MQTRNVNLVVNDVLLVGLAVLLTLFQQTEDSASSEFYMFCVWSMIAVYLLSRIVLIIGPGVACYVLLSVVAAYSLKESYTGLMQLFGHIKSNHYMYACTGSFKNPGPYGGFLAVCISVLGAYAIKGHNKVFRYITGISSLLALILLPSTMSRAALLAVGCAAVLLTVSTETGKAFLRKYRIWLVAVLVIACAGAYVLKKPSADGRLFMNKISIRVIYVNGWKGAGPGRFGGAYGESQALYFQEQIKERGTYDLDWTAINEHDRLTAGCPDNAFNEYLFIGVEHGPIIMLLFMAVIIAAIVVSYRNGTIWCYGLTAFAVFAMFSYPLHVKQFQIMFPVLLAACISHPNGINSKRRRIVVITVLTIVLLALSTIFIIRLPKIKQQKNAESAWKKTESWYNMEYYDYVVEDGDSLFPYMSHDYRFLFAYGQSLNKTGNYEKSDSVLQLGTRISSDPMFWNVMGNNSLALGRYREAEERYKHAFYMVPNRLYPLYLLAKLYHAEGDTVRFLDMADKVETFIPKIESANTEFLRSEIREIKAGYEGTIKQEN